jgi:hypothetical protein
MAAPVVSGTVALMLQANPQLTPNLVKAILQYTAQVYPGYNPLQQGAGFLNALGAVKLARFYAHNSVGSRLPVQSVWSRKVLWGNQQISGGYINPKANAWQNGVLWGAARALDGDNIIWGTDCPSSSCDDIIWGTDDAGFDNIIWGTDDALDNIIWGTEFVGDNIIWGTDDADNIIWGTNCGGADCDNIIWGTEDVLDNIIWGTDDALDNIIWGTSGQGLNVVWLSNDLDNIIWGTSGDDANEVLYPDEDETQPEPDPAAEFGDVEGVL